MFLCRILAEHVSRKYLTLLVNAMARCSYFLVAESSSFSADLVHRFCASTLEQCVNAQMIQHLLAVCVTMRLISFCYSPNQCAIYTSWLTATLCFFFHSWWQVARKICSCVDLSWGGSARLLLDLLKCTTDSVMFKVKNPILHFHCCNLKSVISLPSSLLIPFKGYS